MKRFLKRVCGYEAADASQDTYIHLMEFFNVTNKHTVELEDFCREFVKDENFSTSAEADMVLTTIIEAFEDYKRKRPADPARVKQLSKILGRIHAKRNEVSGQETHPPQPILTTVQVLQGPERIRRVSRRTKIIKSLTSARPAPTSSELPADLPVEQSIEASAAPTPALSAVQQNLRSKAEQA